MIEKERSAELVLEVLHNGEVPWRYPSSRLPEFAKLFGRFYSGPPQSYDRADYSDLDDVVRYLRIRTIHHWKRRTPMFDITLDRMLLPVRSSFSGDAHYHGARTHEVFHYLEQPWRLKWNRTDDKSELMAEIGIGLVESYFQLPPDLDDANIRFWLPKWTEEIRKDPEYLFEALTQSERSLQFLIDVQSKLEAA
jgi:Zincin-like metallopeptidase